MKMPSTPDIGEKELEEISKFVVEDLGSGIVVFRGVFNVEEAILKHIDECAAEAPRQLGPVAAAGDGRRARERVAQVARARHGHGARAGGPEHFHEDPG